MSSILPIFRSYFPWYLSLGFLLTRWIPYISCTYNQYQLYSFNCMAVYVDFKACFFYRHFHANECSSDILNGFEWLRMSDSKELYVWSWLGMFQVKQAGRYLLTCRIVINVIVCEIGSWKRAIGWSCAPGRVMWTKCLPRVTVQPMEADLRNSNEIICKHRKLRLKLLWS